MEVRISDLHRTRFIPARRLSSPLGAESDRACTPGETHTTTVELVSFFGMIHASPLATGGYDQYAGARIKSVTVTTWNNADKLSLRHAGYEKVLTPSSPTATVSADNWWYGSNVWEASRLADNEAYANPELELSLECPTTPVGDTATVAQGYGMSIAQLDTARRIRPSRFMRCAW